MVKVKIREKGGQQQNYEFEQSEVTIGRMKENDIVLPKGNVSKTHARIVGRNGSVLIDDLNSTNGTYVNGRKVTQEHEVSESDKIYIGDFILQIEPEQQRAGAPPQAPPSPPGGGQGQDSSSPPSPPGGGPGGNKQPSGGGNSGGPLGALDEKYGGGGSGPSSRPGPGGGGGGARSRSNTRRDPAVQDQKDTTSNPSARGRRESRSGQNPTSSAGNAPDPDQNRGSRSATDANPAANPSDPGSSSGPSGRSGPSGPPDEAANSGPIPAAESDSGSPDRDGKSDRGQGGDGRGRGRSARRRRSRSGSRSAQSDQPAPPEGRGGRDSDNVRSSQRDERLAGGRRKRTRTTPSVPTVDFQEEFDADFHRAQREVAEALLEDIVLEDLPIAYPPRDTDREEFEAQVSERVEELDPPAERSLLVEILTDECVGLGPLERYLDDPDVQAIHVNAHDRIVLERDGETVVAPHAFSLPEMLEAAAARLVGTRDPGVVTDRFRFGDGTRGTVVRAPLAVDGPAISLVKPDGHHPSIEELREDEALSEGMETFLKTSVESGRTILVAGPHEGDRAGMLEALARQIPDGTRLVSVEQTAQLELPQQSLLRLEVSRANDHDAEDLVESAYDLEADRIVLDSCDRGGAYPWVGAAATGARGSLAAIDALTASDALARLQAACQLDSRETNPRGLREQIAQGVDLVVVADRRPDGGTRIRQITEVQGIDLDAFRLNDVFYFREEGAAGSFHPTGYIPLFFEDLQQMGEDVDLSIFRD